MLARGLSGRGVCVGGASPRDRVDTGSDAPIPVPNVSSNILAKVIEYCKYHVENEPGEGEGAKASEEDMKQWDNKFVEVEQSTLFELILAANYLNIKVRARRAHAGSLAMEMAWRRSRGRRCCRWRAGSSPVD